MWLLDANVPVQLITRLAELGIMADSAVTRGWGTLSDRSLVHAASGAKFTTLLTRDRLFGQSAGAALREYSGFSVILLTLPQLRASRFLEAFRVAWRVSPIIPVPGEIIEWPLHRASVASNGT